MNTYEAVSDVISAAVERNARCVIELSHALHADPELGGAEFRAVERVRAILEAHEFRFPERQPQAPTAFCSTIGTGELTVALCIEYDALPGIGHGCGHNVNGAAAVAAALALAAVADKLDITVKVLGTPAEETTGGKVELIREGYFEDVSLAMMAHASSSDAVGATSLALSAWEVRYSGVAAHAAVAPSAGINALDGLVVAQTAIGLARQQLPLGSIVSLVVLEGGSAANIIPDNARALVEMRAPSATTLARVQRKVRDCLEAGAKASGAELELRQMGNDFADLKQDTFLSEAYRIAMTHRGRDVRWEHEPTASTDMGNVSHVTATIHPLVGYEVCGAVPHTTSFAEHGASPSADQAIVDAAYGLAMAAAAGALNNEQRRRYLHRVTTQLEEHDKIVADPLRAI